MEDVVLARRWHKMRRKIVLKIILALIVLPLFTSFDTGQVEAETPIDVTFTLHKLLFESGKMPAEDAIKNDGTTSPDGKELLTDYTGFNGATFSIYDVTEAFYTLRQDGKSVEAAQQELAKQDPMTKALQEQTTATVNGEDGIANFTVPSKDLSGRDAVYLFIETGKPNEAKTAAKPMVVALPIVDQASQELNTIHLFPKNEQSTHITPTLRKIIAEGRDDFDYGAKIPYKITTTVPNDVQTYKTYTLEDYGDQALWLVKTSPIEASVKVTISDETITDFYTVTSVSDHGFFITFKPDKLKYAAGKTITVTYDMRLKETKKGRSGFENTTILVPGTHKVIQKKKSGVTGGKHFVKVNLKDSTQRLSGAKFIISNSKGEYLRENDGIYEWVTSGRTLTDAQKNQLLILTSDANGMFEINGLAYGEYQLTEISAPTGYIKNNAPIDFSVEEGSYETGAKGALQIGNEPATPPDPSASEPPGTAPPTQPGGNYPKMNTSVNSGLMLLGILLFITGACLFIWRKHHSKSKC